MITELITVAFAKMLFVESKNICLKVFIYKVAEPPFIKMTKNLKFFKIDRNVTNCMESPIIRIQT